MKAVLQLLRSAGEFLLVTVLLKYVIGHKIAKWVERKLDQHPIRYERYLAIWNHHQLKASGEGHDVKSILNCHETSCQVLKTPLASVVSHAQSTNQ